MHSRPASAASSTGALPSAHCAGVSSRFSERVSTRWLSRRFRNLGSNAGARFACAASARISCSLRKTPRAGLTRLMVASSKGSSSSLAAMSWMTTDGSLFFTASSINCLKGCRSSEASVEMTMPSERSRLPLAVCTASRAPVGGYAELLVYSIRAPGRERLASHQIDRRRRCPSRPAFTSMRFQTRLP